jgi:hypothetical protein
MKIYLAAQYERIEEMRVIRDILVEGGHTVTSRWIDQTAGQEEALGQVELTAEPQRGRNYALIDIDDILTADWVVVFTSGNGGGRGGYHTELGYALGVQKKVIVVGPRENVFHTLPRVSWFMNPRSFMEKMVSPWMLAWD